jgi:hypothetical protein
LSVVRTGDLSSSAQLHGVSYACYCSLLLRRTVSLFMHVIDPCIRRAPTSDIDKVVTISLNIFTNENIMSFNFCVDMNRFICVSFDSRTGNSLSTGILVKKMNIEAIPRLELSCNTPLHLVDGAFVLKYFKWREIPVFCKSN